MPFVVYLITCENLMWYKFYLEELLLISKNKNDNDENHSLSLFKPVIGLAVIPIEYYYEVWFSEKS